MAETQHTGYGKQSWEKLLFLPSKVIQLIFDFGPVTHDPSFLTGFPKIKNKVPSDELMLRINYSKFRYIAPSKSKNSSSIAKKYSQCFIEFKCILCSQQKIYIYLELSVILCCIGKKKIFFPL